MGVKRTEPASSAGTVSAEYFLLVIRETEADQQEGWFRACSEVCFH